jgi:hypothetical protein
VLAAAAIDALTVQVSEEIQIAGVNDPNTWELIGAGADGVLDTGDDVDYGISVDPAYASGTDIFLAISPPIPLQEGLYRFTALASGLVDLDDGLAMAADHVRTFRMRQRKRGLTPKRSAGVCPPFRAPPATDRGSPAQRTTSLPQRPPQ